MSEFIKQCKTEINDIVEAIEKDRQAHLEKITTVTTQRDALLAACGKLVEWQTMTKDENLMLFREETGIWPPGKSAPIGRHVDEDNVGKYVQWVEAKADAIRDEIIAAIAATGGGG